MFKIHNERTKTKRKLRVSLKIYRPKILQIQHLQKKRKLQLKYHSFERFQGRNFAPYFQEKFFPKIQGYFSSRFLLVAHLTKCVIYGRKIRSMTETSKGSRSIRQNVSAVETEWLLVHLL